MWWQVIGTSDGARQIDRSTVKRQEARLRVFQRTGRAYDDRADDEARRREALSAAAAATPTKAAAADKADGAGAGAAGAGDVSGAEAPESSNATGAGMQPTPSSAPDTAGKSSRRSWFGRQRATSKTPW